MIQSKGLSAANRPEAVSHWLRVLRRDLAKSPSIQDEVGYAKQWWTWWSGLQPEWRGRDNHGRPMMSGDGAWDCLNKPGVNGMLIVLLSLSWWREIATTLTLDSWNAAAADVAWVIDKLCTSSDPSPEATSRYVSALP